VIGPEGEQLGIMLLEQARLKAAEFQLDLVEVAPSATPPVCRIMDFGKHLYQEQKREQHAHKKAHSHVLKEVRLKPRIGKHDLQVKVNRSREFLAEGNRVQFTMVYKGRERSHQEIGEAIMKDVLASLGDLAKVERGPFREGNRVGLIVAPKSPEAAKLVAKEMEKAKQTAKQPAAPPSKPQAAPKSAPSPAPTDQTAAAAAPGPAAATGQGV
jgi:translation initiation factor IF-3